MLQHKTTWFHYSGVSFFRAQYILSPESVLWPSPYPCILAAPKSFYSISLSLSLSHLCFVVSLNRSCVSEAEDAGSFQEISPTASRRRSFDLFITFSQIALWSLRSPLSFCDWFSSIRISRLLMSPVLMRYFLLVFMVILQLMGLIIVATRLPSLLRAWDTSLARVLVGDLPLGMSFLSCLF